MLKYCIKRILLSIVILLGVSIILYTLVRCMPVSYLESQVYSNPQIENPEQRLLEMQRYYGLEPGFWNAIKGYFSWLVNLCHGDLGVSMVTGQKVGDVIFENMSVSFSISLVALVLELIIAIPLGIKCACNQYGKLDYFATVLTMIGISFPTFFLGSIVIKVFAVELGWFEAGGLSSNLPTTAGSFTRFMDMIWHMVLPMFVLVILSIGSWLRYTRTNTLEVLNADYIRTARAKGLSENSVIYKHVFRNTLIPLVTLLAGTLPSLFCGAMITEQVFDLPGIGNKAYDLMQSGDIPFIMGYNMFIAMLTVIGILITDIMYAVVDPRVKLGD